MEFPQSCIELGQSFGAEVGSTIIGAMDGSPSEWLLERVGISTPMDLLLVATAGLSLAVIGLNADKWRKHPDNQNRQ